jgi:transcription-repair coupling factor (superfamily II helicase)
MILRLSTYRKISAAKNEDDLRDIGAEMADRFGPPPEEFNNLLKIMSLRLLAERLSVTGIRQVDGRLRFTLARDASLGAEGVLKAFDGKVRFFGEGFELDLEEDVYVHARTALEKLPEGR